jgi:ParB family transcriptional regulator, chromosome partitioning protein
MKDREVKGKKSGLGKGLNSLLGLSGDEASAGAGAEAKTPMSVSIFVNPWDIEPNPQQPRRFFDNDKLTELAESIKVDGILQPLLVSKQAANGKYTLIAGERRWRAAKLAGLDIVPVIVKDSTSNDLLRLALIENIQRADLNVVEEAEAYGSLINDYGLTQEECAKRVGKERSTVTNTLRILSLPKEVLDDLVEGRLAMGHARALLSLEEKKIILRARDIIIKKDLSVRQTEQLVKRIKQVGFSAGKKEKGDFDPDIEYLADSLRSKLKTKVKFHGNSARGRIEISYFSPTELERIIGILSH